jgi:hypothetical protein
MGPLAGKKIIEIGGIGPGPVCGMMLADMGGEVILVERKPTGESIAGPYGDPKFTTSSRKVRRISSSISSGMPTHCWSAFVPESWSASAWVPTFATRLTRNSYMVD